MSSTTFNCDNSLWQGLQIPMLFTSMGCNFFHDQKHQAPLPQQRKEKFLHFFKSLLKNDKVYIALRNDGSLSLLEKEFPQENFSQCTAILDNGFFYEQSYQNDFLQGRKYLAINVISKDALQKEEWQRYCENLNAVLDYIIDELDLVLCFVPHVPQDLEAICEILSYQSEKHKRTSIYVAALLQGEYGANFIGSVYERSEFSIVSRFHASVLCFVNKTKVIALCHSYQNRMEALYQSVNLRECFVNASEDFGQDLIYLLKHYPHKKAEFKEAKARSLAFYEDFFKSFFKEI